MGRGILLLWATIAFASVACTEPSGGFAGWGAGGAVAAGGGGAGGRGGSAAGGAAGSGAGGRGGSAAGGAAGSGAGGRGGSAAGGAAGSGAGGRGGSAAGGAAGSGGAGSGGAGTTGAGASGGACGEPPSCEGYNDRPDAGLAAVITCLSPNPATRNVAFTLAIYGHHLATGPGNPAIVTLDSGVPLNGVPVTACHLDVQVPAAQVATARQAVVVVSPGGPTQDSGPATLTVQ